MSVKQISTYNCDLMTRMRRVRIQNKTKALCESTMTSLMNFNIQDHQAPGLVQYKAYCCNVINKILLVGLKKDTDIVNKGITWSHGQIKECHDMGFGMFIKDWLKTHAKDANVINHILSMVAMNEKFRGDNDFYKDVIPPELTKPKQKSAGRNRVRQNIFNTWGYVSITNR
jgi:hypothetical protein